MTVRTTSLLGREPRKQVAAVCLMQSALCRPTHWSATHMADCTSWRVLLQVLKDRQALELGKRQPPPRLSRSAAATPHRCAVLAVLLPWPVDLQPEMLGAVRGSTVLSCLKIHRMCRESSLLLTCSASVWLQEEGLRLCSAHEICRQKPEIRCSSAEGVGLCCASAASRGHCLSLWSKQQVRDTAVTGPVYVVQTNAKQQGPSLLVPAQQGGLQKRPGSPTVASELQAESALCPSACRQR